ncbi:hypothetical protein ACLOJK_028350 [Asimina triloba]
MTDSNNERRQQPPLASSRFGMLSFHVDDRPFSQAVSYSSSSSAMGIRIPAARNSSGKTINRTARRPGGEHLITAAT